MLKEAREELNKQTRQHEEEIQLINEQLHNKRDMDFIRFKEYVERGGNPAHFHGPPSSAEVNSILVSRFFLSLPFVSVGTHS